MKKVLSVLVIMCMLLQLTVMGNSDGNIWAGQEFVIELSDASGKGVITYSDIQRGLEGFELLNSLMYNSSHYDEIGIDRPDPSIDFQNIATGEITTVNLTKSPLICVEYGGFYEDGSFFPGIFDLKIDVTGLEPGYYNTSVNLTIPQGKGIGTDVRPIIFVIDRLQVIGGAGSTPGGGTGIDRTSVSEEYYDAAKVCYDLGIMENVYDDSKKTVTKADLAVALVNVYGAQSAAESLKNRSIFTDVEAGSYLAGCVNWTYQMGILSGNGGGAFGVDTEMVYEQIIKALVSLLGYDPMAQNYGGYPSGYLTIAYQRNIAKGVQSSIGSKITVEMLSQLIYNTLFSKRLVVDSYSMYGDTYKEVDESLFFLQGYEKYVGEVDLSGDYISVKGKCYNESYPKGADVTSTELKSADGEIYCYPDDGMTLFVKDYEILSGIKYYSVNFSINDNQTMTEDITVSIAVEEVGYSYYKINGSEPIAIPDSKVFNYRLSGGCGEKTVQIEFLNSDMTVSKTISKSITLKRKHTLEYHVDGEVFDSVSVFCGEAIPELENIPTKEGFKFEYWDSLPEVMPDYDFYVKAIFSELEPEVTVFETTLPNQESGIINSDLVIENIEELVDENYRFALRYASSMYNIYIEDLIVFTFTKGDDAVTYSLGMTPLEHKNGVYNLTIPVKDVLSPGTYTLTIDLPIAKLEETEGLSPFKFTIEEFVVSEKQPGEGEETVNTTFTVKDTTDLTAVKGAQIFVSNEEGTIKKTAVTNQNGVAEFSLDNGTYSVQVVAKGYEMRNFVVEKTEENCDFTPYLNKNSLLDIKTSVKEMSKKEMVAAGIDINAPENKHVYKCVTVLKFIPVTTGGDINITPIEIEFDYVYDAQGTVIKAKPAQVEGKIIYPVSKDIYLIINSEVTWLKEMFDVQLVVANTSKIETIEECMATLNLPEGLSLAVMNNGEQTLNVDMGTIAPEGMGDVHWYICGDVEGEYLLNGNVTANRVGGGITEPLKAAFVMQQPITVLAGNAMKLVIEAEKYATAGEFYKVKYTLYNVSNKTLYDVALDAIGGKFRKAYSVEELKQNGELVNLEGLSGEFNDGVKLEKEEFKPGESISGVFEIMFAQGIDLEYINYMVSEMFTFTGPGSTTTIPTEIKLVDVVREHDFDNGVVTRKSTCTQEGEIVYKCKDCSHSEKIVLAKTEHILGEWIVRTEATCVQAGEKYKKCENCDYEITAALLEGAHKWDSGKITVIPTTEEKGLKTYTCTECGETKTRVLPKKDASLTYTVDAVVENNVVTVTVNNDLEVGQRGAFFFAVYDEFGKMTGMFGRNITVEGSKNITYTFNVEEGTSFKGFVWDLSNGLRPRSNIVGVED